MFLVNSRFIVMTIGEVGLPRHLLMLSVETLPVHHEVEQPKSGFKEIVVSS